MSGRVTFRRSTSIRETIERVLKPEHFGIKFLFLKENIFFFLLKLVKNMKIFCCSVHFSFYFIFSHNFIVAFIHFDDLWVRTAVHRTHLVRKNSQKNKKFTVFCLNEWICGWSSSLESHKCCIETSYCCCTYSVADFFQQTDPIYN